VPGHSQKRNLLNFRESYIHVVERNFHIPKNTMRTPTWHQKVATTGMAYQKTHSKEWVFWYRESKNFICEARVKRAMSRMSYTVNEHWSSVTKQVKNL